MLKVSTDITKALKMLGASEKAIKYATVDGINKTAELVQAAEVKHLAKQFKLKTSKSSQFIKRQMAIIKPFAKLNQKEPTAIISLEAKGRLLLPLFEIGGEQLPQNAKNVAVPLVGADKARPSKDAPIPSKNLIKNLQLQKYKGQIQSKITGSVDKKGRLKTTTKGFFLIPNVGIFKRKGKSQQAVMIYSFKKRVRIVKNMQWEKVAVKTANSQLSAQVLRKYATYVRQGRGV